MADFFKLGNRTDSVAHKLEDGIEFPIEAGNLLGIRRYCETDVLNTYLIYLRFELMRGRMTRERYAEEVEREI